MSIQAEILTGIMFGIEYVDVPELEDRYVVVDIGFLRLLFIF
jgi:hypothetical protein